MYDFFVTHAFELIIIGQMCLALILGSLIGIQREARGRSAGARTYALVSGGSCLFTLLSIYAFGNNGDISRVASQIVTGIGFLGAGTILHKSDRVEGLTTAAGLWMVAAIGMSVGVGYYIIAIAVTILTLLVLIIDDKKFIKNDSSNLDRKI